MSGSTRSTTAAPTPGHGTRGVPRATAAECRKPAGASPGSHAQVEGFAFSGPGYYVWDEDRRCASEWAEQLAGLAGARGGEPR